MTFSFQIGFLYSIQLFWSTRWLNNLRLPETNENYNGMMSQSLACSTVYLLWKEVFWLLRLGQKNMTIQMKAIYWPVLSFGADYHTVQANSNFLIFGWNQSYWMSSTFLWCCLLCWRKFIQLLVCSRLYCERLFLPTKCSIQYTVLKLILIFESVN